MYAYVKGSKAEALAAADAHGIKGAIVLEDSNPEGDSIHPREIKLFVPFDYERQVVAWFCELPESVAPFPPGTLLFYSAGRGTPRA